MSYHAVEYLFEGDFVEEFSDGEESIRADEPYISYDDDMASFEDEEFYRAYADPEEYEEYDDYLY
ncbi:hypothetical protein ATCVCan0610SP_763R [Acanthocystis turfacea Chlorella virus Can0610SP]|nr:hypothetical protein ATCVCan0610SP_763R [Acanthocystis turfacea Chlorella virus Can0610SP]